MDALLSRVYDVVEGEHRPCSIKDFVPRFLVDGKEYTIAQGTFRNYISRLKRLGLVRLSYVSVLAFYTLPGVKFTREKQHKKQEEEGALLKMIRDLPVEQRALHDIHMRFKVRGIWSVLSSDSQLHMNPISKDISVAPLSFGDVKFTVTVHRTDTVSVIAGCSMHPIAVDVNGLVALTEHLTRVENELARIIERTGKVVGGHELEVPRHPTWLVTMWHFGMDGSAEFSGEDFCTTWNDGNLGLLRIYSKDMKEKGKRIRIERQEHPNRSLVDLIEEKFNQAA